MMSKSLIHYIIPFWREKDGNIVIGSFISDKLRYLNKSNKDYRIHLIQISFTKPYSIIHYLKNRSSPHPSKTCRFGDEFSFINLKYGLLDYIFPSLYVNKVYHHLNDVIVNSNQVNIFHLHITGLYHCALIRALEMVNLPFVVTTNGPEIESIIKYNDYFGWYRQLFERIPKIIFVSRGQLLSAKNAGLSGSNAVIINNGVDLSLFYPMDKQLAERMTSWKRTRTYVIGYVGMLYDVKRSDLLPDIFKNISTLLDDDCEFVIVGDGNLRETIFQKCEEYELKVTFVGTIPHNTVVYWMNLFNVLILPSRQEGFGNVIIEAKACGVPTVGTNVGGIPSAIGNSGILVDEGDNFEMRFSDAVVSLLLRKKSINRDDVIHESQEYDLKLVVDKELNQYDLQIKP